MRNCCPLYKTGYFYNTLSIDILLLESPCSPIGPSVGSSRFLSHLTVVNWNSPCKNNKNEQNWDLYIYFKFHNKGLPRFFSSFFQEHNLIFMHKKVQLYPTSHCILGKHTHFCFTIHLKIIFNKNSVKKCTYINFWHLKILIALISIASAIVHRFMCECVKWHGGWLGGWQGGRRGYRQGNRLGG